MVPLPPAQACLEHLLTTGDPWAEVVLQSEWAVLAGVYLVEQFRVSRRMWLYPPRLLKWIREVGVDFICQGPDGDEFIASCQLTAMLTLSESLSRNQGFSERLARVDPVRRDRSSWVYVRVDRLEDAWVAQVDEDLAPWDLPYSTDVLDGRELQGVEPAADGAPPPDPAAPAGSPVGIPLGGVVRSVGRPVRRGAHAAPRPVGPPRPSPSVMSIVDVPGEALGTSTSPVGPTAGIALAHLLMVDTVSLEGVTSGILVSSLLSTIAFMSGDVAKWAAEHNMGGQPEMDTLLGRLGRESVGREVMAHVESRTAARERREEQWRARAATLQRGHPDRSAFPHGESWSRGPQ